MPKIDVCLTPELIPLFKMEQKIVVVIDILRATSCMVTAFEHGVSKILPVATLDESAHFGQKGYVTAAERNGLKMEGFDLDNSPFSYMHPSLFGKKICVTTTNGTKAIVQSAHAKKVIIGSFLNLRAICDYLYIYGQDVILLCAGWKGQVNAEDTLFAGAVIEELKESFDMGNDSALIARDLYNCHKHDLLEFVKTTSHFQRLNRLNIHKDIDFCLQHSIYNNIPRLEGKSLIKN